MSDEPKKPPRKRSKPQNRGAEGEKAKPLPPVGRRFQKGQSGNPGGLSAERRAFLAELRKGEEPYSRQVVEKLRSLALKGIQWAMVDYLDRLGVRMPEKLEVSGEDGKDLPVGINPLDPSSMTTDQVRKRMEALQKERERILSGESVKQAEPEEQAPDPQADDEVDPGDP